MKRSEAESRSMPGAFALIVVAYVTALCVAVGVGYAAGERHPVLVAFVADVAGTLVIYGFSRAFRNASFYDPYWSVAPIAIALYFAVGVASADVNVTRQAVVFALVCAWGLRLTYNWARGWRGLGHEDWRYAKLRRESKGSFWLVELSGIEMMPTTFVFLGCLSLYPALAVGSSPFGVLDWFAIVVTAGAIIIETAADRQLRDFVAAGPQPGEIMKSGLWTFSRHPNYFGEITFWWGLFMFAMAADSSYWWTFAGPLAITALFVGVSIPLMDKRNLERRPGYDEHMKSISALIPWFPRKPKTS